MKVFLDAPLLVYLNVVDNAAVRRVYEDFYLQLLTEYSLYTDVLVLDELVYVSRRKYEVPYNISLDFVEGLVLPYVKVLPLEREEFVTAKKYIRDGIKPSDALHIAAMENNGIRNVATEDRDFEKISWIKKIWVPPI